MAVLLALVLVTAPPEAPWATLAPGVQYRALELRPDAGSVDVVRIEPAAATLVFALASEDGGPPLTAGQWADRRGLVVAINAGMYAVDHRTNVGYLRSGSHLNQPAWNGSYQSVLCFGPSQAGLPSMTLIDRDAPGAPAMAAKYRYVVQNLRLIRAPGVNVWKPNGRRWSESLVAQDSAGRIVFVFSRAPWEMVELVDALLGSELRLVRAMHVEGGPEASLSIRSPAMHLDRAGSFESGFFDGSNTRQWAIPNVIGVAPAEVR